MKSFRLFQGGIALVGTFDITENNEYQLIVETVNQLRKRLLENPVLRRPLLDLFDSVYRDDSAFPDDLKETTPLADQIPNRTKIRQIRFQPPTDGDVITFLTDAFPHLYLKAGSFNENDILWEETTTGHSQVNEEISINVQLVRQWRDSVSSAASSATRLSGMELAVLFSAVFLHELAYSSLVWYGMGACDSPRLGCIDGEAGNFYEKAIFGGISACEIDREGLRIAQVGFYKGQGTQVFCPIDQKQAEELLKFDTSAAFPLLNNFSLSSAPPIASSKFRAKASLSRIMNRVLGSESGDPENTPHIYTTLKGDKKRILPS